MASKAKNRRNTGGRNRAADSQRRPNARTLDQATVLARSWDRVARYVRQASSAEQALKAAKHDAREALRRIVSLAVDKDITRVLQSVRTTAALSDDRTSELAPVAIELITLAIRSTSARSPSQVAGSSAGDSWFPPDILGKAVEAWEAGSMVPFFSLKVEDPFAQVEFASRMRELTLRNPVYPHMLLDTFQGLFADPAVDADTRAVLGFSGAEAVEIMEAVRLVSVEGLQERFDRFSSVSDAVLPIMGLDPARPGRNLKKPNGEKHDGPSVPLSAESMAVVKEWKTALDDLTTNVGETGLLDIGVIAARSAKPSDIVVRVLEAFEYKEQLSIDSIVDRFFAGDNPLRTAPVVRDSRGNFTLVHDALALPAVREMIEQRIQAAGRWNNYQQHRGEWVEKAAIDLLVRHFPHANVYRGFRYFVPDPKVPVPQMEPEKFTKRVEADGLIIIDDVALIIEVKSVALTPEARGGGTIKLRNSLRAIVTDAVQQANRLRERIENDGRIRLDDGQWIDCTGIREIHCVAVGLEDLSGVITATADLVHAGILPPDRIPWTVSLHDLRAISEVADRPAEILLYLRRRTEFETTLKFRAVDELDLFLLFLSRGLFVEPDPVAISAKFPLFGPPQVGALRRRKAQRREIVMGRTGPLDNWYNHQDDTTAEPARKPAFDGHKDLMTLVDAVAASQAPGWLAISTALIEGNGVVQRQLGQTATELARLTRRDGKAHDIVQTMLSSQGPIVLIWRTYPSPEQASSEADILRRHVAAKKHQLGVPRAGGFLFDARTATLDQLVYDNRIPGPDPQLDEIAKYLKPPDAGRGVNALTALKRSATPPRRKKNR